MFKKIVVLAFLWCLCKCDHNYSVDCKKPHHHHHHDDYYGVWYGTGILYYLAFLALKVKVAFIIGGFITLVIFFTKLWALIKYSTYILDKKNDDHHHHEKIYVQTPHDYGHNHYAPPPTFSHGPPGYSLNHAYLDSPPPGQQERAFKDAFSGLLVKLQKFKTPSIT